MTQNFQNDFCCVLMRKRNGFSTILSLGKETIPYALITQYDSLDIVPDEGDFFRPHQFFSSLKDNPSSEEEYKQVKKFCKTLKL